MHDVLLGGLALVAVGFAAGWALRKTGATRAAEVVKGCASALVRLFAAGCFFYLAFGAAERGEAWLIALTVLFVVLGIWGLFMTGLTLYFRVFRAGDSDTSANEAS